MSLQLLRTDFRFAVATLIAIIAVLFIAPFAVYRFVAGQWLAGVVDVLIVACIMSGVVYVWRGGDLSRVSIMVIASSTIGCLAIVAVAGNIAVPWIYAVLLANFLVVDRKMAVIAAAVVILGAALLPEAFDSLLQRLVFATTALAVSLFAFVFAHRTETQREQLETLAGADSLTGAYNRRAMDRELQIAVDSMRRDGIPVGLALLDLDHFKRINDSFGHEAGDHVLVAFARVVASATRRSDRLFRFGGEEFVLLLPGAGADVLPGLCEKLRKSVADQLRHQDDVITVSIGAAALMPGEDVATWLGRADAAMYRAKHEGRNRVVIDVTHDPPAGMA